MKYMVILLLLFSAGYFYSKISKKSPLEAAKADFEKTVRSQFVAMNQDIQNVEINHGFKAKQQKRLALLLSKLTAIQQEYAVIPIPTSQVLDLEEFSGGLPKKIIQEWVPCSSEKNPMDCLVQFMPNIANKM